MKFTTIALLLFGAAGALAGQPPDHVVAPSETLSKIAATAGYDWRALCAFNSLANCNSIVVGQTIRFPKRGDSVIVQKQPASCITLGVAPWNTERDNVLRQARALEGINFLTELLPEKRELAKAKFLMGEKATEKELVGTQVFTEMLYRSQVSGQAKHVYGKPICSPDDGGQPEVMDTYDLGDGVFLAIPRRCGNPAVFVKSVPRREEESPAVVPQDSPPSSPAVVEKPAEPQVVSPPEVDQVARDYDFDAHLYFGGDKDVRFAGFEGAGYPVIKYYGWGRYAGGGGGWLSLWNGGTPDGFRFSGELATFGLAQKFSFANRRDVGLKLVYGDLWTRGHDDSGRYRQKERAHLACVGVAYTDAAREKAGETWFPEYSLSASYCDPFSQRASHSYDGQEIATPPTATKYVAGVSAQLIIRKNLGDEGLANKLQPVAELGFNQTAPNPVSGHAYLGLRTTNKVWTLGVGPHWSNLGTTPGATLVYNAGRDYKLGVEQERWDKMIQSLEALGVATD